MAKRKSKYEKRQEARKIKRRLETAARHAGISASSTSSSCLNTGMSSPFCLRSASNPTTSELYRQTAPVDHAHQLSISACGSNHVQWVSGVGVLLWSQHT